MSSNRFELLGCSEERACYPNCRLTNCIRCRNFRWTTAKYMYPKCNRVVCWTAGLVCTLHEVRNRVLLLEFTLELSRFRDNSTSKRNNECSARYAIHHTLSSSHATNFSVDLQLAQYVILKHRSGIHLATNSTNFLTRSREIDIDIQRRISLGFSYTVNHTAMRVEYVCGKSCREYKGNGQLVTIGFSWVRIFYTKWEVWASGKYL